MDFAESCPLCKLFYDSDEDLICNQCPVMLRSGRSFCEGTPWTNISYRYYILKHKGKSKEQILADPKFQRLCKAEAEFLKRTNHMKITQEILEQITQTKAGSPVKDLVLLPKPIDEVWWIAGALVVRSHWLPYYWTIEGGFLNNNADNGHDLKIPVQKPTYREFRYEDVRPGMLARRTNKKEAFYFDWRDGQIVTCILNYSPRQALEELELSTDGITWGPFGVKVEEVV